jgi:glycosyltransferase involved in cell wall biosynthesis
VLAAVPEARLVIAGPTKDVSVPTMVGVTVLGPLPPEAVGGLLDSARAAVLPSRKEALPMFLIEAMAHARPVVATPVGDVESLVQTEWIVPVEDAESLAAALVRVLQDPALATTVGDRNRSIIADRFSVDVVHPQFDALYESMSG